jgi:hypothetical protein
MTNTTKADACARDGGEDARTYLAPPSVRAPWTDEQVAILNAHQARDDVHPYTCENWHGEPVERRNLVATNDGWICRHCTYTQKWAHGSHFKAAAP